jgi:hypothetical protein
MIDTRRDLVDQFRKNGTKHSLGLVVFNLAIMLTLMLIYFSNYLNERLQNAFLTSENFGVPPNLASEGITPFFTEYNQSGWDGQFYYYISNDIFNQAATSNHIDSPSYRWQRAGFAIVVNVISKLFGQNWVSPLLYFTVYFTLLAFALVIGAKLFKLFGHSHDLILLWGLSVGTIVTVFNGLPDAAADCFLIIALYSYAKKKTALYSISITFAILSRETYLLCALIIVLVESINFFRRRKHQDNSDKSKNKWIWFLAPITIGFMTQLLLKLKFGIFPSTQAYGVLDFPLATTFKRLNETFPQSSPTLNLKLFLVTNSEFISLCLFVGLLLLNLIVLLQSRKKVFQENDPFTQVIYILTLALTIMYACFGPTVMSFFTGYMKASSIFFFLTPLLLVLVGKKRLFRSSVIIMIIANLFLNGYNFYARILPESPTKWSVSELNLVTNTNSIECLSRYDTTITPISHKLVIPSKIGSLFGADNYLDVLINAQNLTGSDLVSTKGAGSTHLSYQWVADSGKVVQDGLRHAIIKPFKNKESRDFRILVKIPNTNLKPKLQISFVQEGCAWFYLNSTAPSSGKSEPLGEY